MRKVFRAPSLNTVAADFVAGAIGIEISGIFPFRNIDNRRIGNLKFQSIHIKETAVVPRADVIHFTEHFRCIIERFRRICIVARIPFIISTGGKDTSRHTEREKQRKKFQRFSHKILLNRVSLLSLD